MVSEIFKKEDWNEVFGLNFEDITYHQSLNHKVTRIAFNRPNLRNAFRPQTVDELLVALRHSEQDQKVGSVILTGNGPSSKDAGWAFCSGGDQKVRGPNGYEYKDEKQKTPSRLHILEVQRFIRSLPKVVLCVVPGWAVGGGHSLHVTCDLTLASLEHGKFKQTDADVGSFDGGYGSAYLAKMVGQKKAREIFFLGKTYSATEAKEMGMVNEVVAHDQLETVALKWAQTIAAKSPTAIRMLKFAMNLTDDGMVGQQIFAGEATRLAYASQEAQEGRNAFLEKRPQDFKDFPWEY